MNLPNNVRVNIERNLSFRMLINYHYQRSLIFNPILLRAETVHNDRCRRHWFCGSRLVISPGTSWGERWTLTSIWHSEINNTSWTGCVLHYQMRCKSFMYLQVAISYRSCVSGRKKTWAVWNISPDMIQMELASSPIEMSGDSSATLERFVMQQDIIAKEVRSLEGILLTRATSLWYEQIMKKWSLVTQPVTLVNQSINLFNVNIITTPF